MTKPYIKQHSSKYERDQFFEILKMQQGRHFDIIYMVINI